MMSFVSHPIAGEISSPMLQFKLSKDGNLFDEQIFLKRVVVLCTLKGEALQRRTQ